MKELLFDTPPKEAYESHPSRPLTFYLPETLEPYREDIRRFVDAMLYKMKRNVHKGRWEGYTLLQSLKLLEGEVNELREAYYGGNSVEMQLEAADVANFAMILSSIVVEKGK